MADSQKLPTSPGNLKSPGNHKSHASSDSSDGQEPRKHGDTVIIAMDGSEYSDYALRCKYMYMCNRKL